MFQQTMLVIEIEHDKNLTFLPSQMQLQPAFRTTRVKELLAGLAVVFLQQSHSATDNTLLIDWKSRR